MLFKRELKIRNLIFASLIAFLPTLIVTFIIIGASITLNVDNIELEIQLSMMSYTLITLGILIYIGKISKGKIKELKQDFKNKIDLKEIIGRVVNAQVIQLGTMSLFIGVALLIINESILNELLENLTTTKDMVYEGSVILNAISIILIAPIYEEIAYREILFKRLSKKINVKWGIIISSIIFGIGHTSASIVFAIFFGIVCCLLYLKYDNILIPMFLHFVNNAFGVLTTITPSSEVNEEALLLVKSDAFMFLIMGAIASILGFYFLVRFIKRTNKHIKSTI
ncbi:MAG: lysostaphin resistance A-like protein [Peptostreptococcaceae bacterium]